MASVDRMSSTSSTSTPDYAERIIQELGRTLALIPPADAERLTEAILCAGKILVAGAGRSGLAVKAFAMRLAHMGFEAYVVGETVTPNFEAADLLLIGSGSGETGSLVAVAARARQLGGTVALVTIFPDSTIGRQANLTVRITAPSPKVQGAEALASIQPMGSLFEQSLFLFLDTLVLKLMETRAADGPAMFRRHANLE
jgi:6-phospho-3-hexuloisomerase